MVPLSLSAISNVNRISLSLCQTGKKKDRDPQVCVCVCVNVLYGTNDDEEEEECREVSPSYIHIKAALTFPSLGSGFFFNISL